MLDAGRSRSSVISDLTSDIRHLLPEGSAEWSATGPENQGDREVRGSIPQPSAISDDRCQMTDDRCCCHPTSDI
jgi:hypothetical protein